MITFNISLEIFVRIYKKRNKVFYLVIVENAYIYNTSSYALVSLAMAFKEFRCEKVYGKFAKSLLFSIKFSII